MCKPMSVGGTSDKCIYIGDTASLITNVDYIQI